MSKFIIGTIAAAGLFLATGTQAHAQYLPPQYFAPGYGAYYQNYPTYNGGVVNRTQYTTPFGTTNNRQYYNPYTGYGVSSSSYQSFGNYNSPFISPALTPYYSGPGYGTYYVQPNRGVRIIR